MVQLPNSQDIEYKIFVDSIHAPTSIFQLFHIPMRNRQLLVNNTLQRHTRSRMSLTDQCMTRKSFFPHQISPQISMTNIRIRIRNNKCPQHPSIKIPISCSIAASSRNCLSRFNSGCLPAIHNALSATERYAPAGYVSVHYLQDNIY